MLVQLADLSSEQLDRLAHVTLASARGHVADWLENLEAARAELAEAWLPGKVSRVWLDGSEPLGWVAAEPAWGRIWELHPLIVAVEHQRRGIGRALVAEVERIARDADALTMMLGTSDTVGATSLYGVDLYVDTGRKLDELVVHEPHAVTFWQRVGYRVIGVEPDAEGPGKPSILLAKRL